MSPKQKAFRAMSPYVRLSDAIDYHLAHGFDLSCIDPKSLVVACCSCGVVRSWISMDAGHYIGRGLGGRSGVYLDERNVHAQCVSCNRFQEGNRLGYTDFMLKKYGQAVIDELRRLDKTRKYTLMEIEGLRLYYIEEYKKLLEG